MSAIDIYSKALLKTLEANAMNPNQTAPMSSLTRVHVVNMFAIY